MVIAGPCPQFRAHDEGAEEFLTGQAACFHLRFQMGQFLFVEMERDDVVSFSHSEAPFNVPCCRAGACRAFCQAGL